jgi:hypothetical protein
VTKPIVTYHRWSRRSESNRQPADYGSAALPSLSYVGVGDAIESRTRIHGLKVRWPDHLAYSVQAYGWPDLERATTSHIERQNLTVRMSMRRMTRLTNAFSKKWLNLKRAYAVQFAYYNFCRVHSSLQKCTPAMVSGLTNHVWTIEELIANHP